MLHTRFYEPLAFALYQFQPAYELQTEAPAFNEAHPPTSMRYCIQPILQKDNVLQVPAHSGPDVSINIHPIIVCAPLSLGFLSLFSISVAELLRVRVNYLLVLVSNSKQHYRIAAQQLHSDNNGGGGQTEEVARLQCEHLALLCSQEDTGPARISIVSVQ